MYTISYLQLVTGDGVVFGSIGGVIGLLLIVGILAAFIRIRKAKSSKKNDEGINFLAFSKKFHKSFIKSECV